MEHNGYYMHGGGGHGFFAWFLLFVAVALLVALIVLLVTRLGRPQHAMQAATGTAATDGPLELLRLRYARGEIDRDTFLQTNADLGGPAPPG